jgi:two-component system, chemotaxis family, chemotaxis protein CheY
MKALVAEDDLTSRLLLQNLLAPYGRVYNVANGVQAVEAFRRAHREGQPFDLICLDIMMPEMDGQATLKLIRRIEESEGMSLDQGAKILMVTVLDDAKDIFTAFRELCDGYLVKPVNRDSLSRYLAEFKLIEE